jgi:hypothetical protein
MTTAAEAMDILERPEARESAACFHPRPSWTGDARVVQF